MNIEKATTTIEHSNSCNDPPLLSIGYDHNDASDANASDAHAAFPSWLVVAFSIFKSLGRWLFYLWAYFVMPIGTVLLLRKLSTKDGMNSGIDTGKVRDYKDEDYNKHDNNNKTSKNNTTNKNSKNNKFN